MDFSKFSFCNDNNFYVLMDIIDAVYNLVAGPVTVRRIANDGWQREVLPILLNLREDYIAARIKFEEVTAP